jgi:hypothetical protein
MELFKGGGASYKSFRTSVLLEGCQKRKDGRRKQRRRNKEIRYVQALVITA